jgi:DNA-binding NtrC family response regulator
MRDAVLISWIAFNHDPYERQFRSREYRHDNSGQRIPGPTLTLLFDEQSVWRGKVDTIYLFRRDTPEGQRRVQDTFDAIRDQDADIVLRECIWDGDDPTNYRGIHGFARVQISKIRSRHDGPLLIHISPGTPAMQTIWVLMGETGFIEPPFRLLKSLKPRERTNQLAVEDVSLDLDTFYKRYRQSRPVEQASEQSIFWDPGQFQSDALRQLFDDAARLARLRVPVLILGERGTGKTTLASWIRLQSPFRKPDLDCGWPAVACGQYRPDTMRSELFGHKKGSFTGANQDHRGLLARADGDTLFLDEIGDLARDMQRLLIKAIEERRFQPFGETRWLNSTFRLITATNIPLDLLRQKLDADFFDRIAVIRLRAPNLREIPEELVWLWPAVFKRVSQQSGVRVPLTDEHHHRVLGYLRGHSLPGNLRSLFALSWRLIARWLDHAPTESELTAWLPTALDSPAATTHGDLARDIAARFANGLPLDDLIPEGGTFQTKQVQQAIQRWIAEEIKRIALNRGVSQRELVDVTTKTLRTWRNQT